MRQIGENNYILQMPQTVILPEQKHTLPHMPGRAFTPKCL